jgi:hypothetical protein
MNQLNGILTQIGNWLFSPFAEHPTIGLLVWSALTGVAMTYVFGKTSNQTGLTRAANRVRAQLLAVKLFKDDLTVTMWCQVALMKATGARLWHSVPPMLVMLVPLFLVLTQLALRYEFRPLLPGETAVLAMHLKPEAWKTFQDLRMQTSAGVTQEAGSLRDAKNETLYWRIRVNGEESERLRWDLGDQTIEKELSIASHADVLQPTNPIRPGTGFWDRVFYPGEPGLAADSPVASIEVHHTRRMTPILGVDIPWWATFFLVSMLVAFVAGKIIGVQY